jgi:hypothetical protein
MRSLIGLLSSLMPAYCCLFAVCDVEEAILVLVLVIVIAVGIQLNCLDLSQC